MWRGDALRLFGVSASDLRDASLASQQGSEGTDISANPQFSIFDTIGTNADADEKQEKKQKELLEAIQDNIRERFGSDAVTRATLKKGNSIPIIKNVYKNL